MTLQELKAIKTWWLRDSVGVRIPGAGTWIWLRYGGAALVEIGRQEIWIEAHVDGIYVGLEGEPGHAFIPRPTPEELRRRAEARKRRRGLKGGLEPTGRLHVRV